MSEGIKDAIRILTGKEVDQISGGWIYGTYSTADLHKLIYGGESPYGRDPNGPPFNYINAGFSWISK